MNGEGKKYHDPFWDNFEKKIKKDLEDQTKNMSSGELIEFIKKMTNWEKLKEERLNKKI